MASRRLTAAAEPAPRAQEKGTRRQRIAAWFFVIILLVSALGALITMLASP